MQVHLRKTSEKTKRDYTIVNLLDIESGAPTSCIAEQISDKVQKLKPVLVAFQLTTGNYTSLKALDIQPAI